MYPLRSLSSRNETVTSNGNVALHIDLNSLIGLSPFPSPGFTVSSPRIAKMIGMRRCKSE